MGTKANTALNSDNTLIIMKHRGGGIMLRESLSSAGTGKLFGLDWKRDGALSRPNEKHLHSMMQPPPCFTAAMVILYQLKEHPLVLVYGIKSEQIK